MVYECAILMVSLLSSVQIEGFPPNCRHCMWDQVDRDVLMVSDGKELHTYVHSHTTIRGSMVRPPVAFLLVECACWGHV